MVKRWEDRMRGMAPMFTSNGTRAADLTRQECMQKEIDELRGMLAASAGGTLLQLCDRLDAMKRRPRHTPGTGQTESYLLADDVEAYVEEARKTLGQLADTAGHCADGDRCVCGGDLPRIREGCSNWRKP